jgi:hypothetical protein
MLFRDGTVLDYAQIARDPELASLRLQLDAFWGALSTRRIDWPPSKLVAFLGLAFKSPPSSPRRHAPPAPLASYPRLRARAL